MDWTRSKQPNSPEADHIKPHAKGGRDDIENVRIICRKCNQELGGMMTKRQRPVIHTTELESSPIW
jgi:5-methylcytosine-specific restriction endonuclease McrA